MASAAPRLIALESLVCERRSLVRATTPLPLSPGGNAASHRLILARLNGPPAA